MFLQFVYERWQRATWAVFSQEPFTLSSEARSVTSVEITIWLDWLASHAEMAYHAAAPDFYLFIYFKHRICVANSGAPACPANAIYSLSHLPSADYPRHTIKNHEIRKVMWFWPSHTAVRGSAQA